MGIHIENTWKPQWAWGTFYSNASASQTIEEPGTFQPLAFTSGEWVATIGLSTNETDGIATFDFSGLYYVNAVLCFSGATNDEFTLAFYKDGTTAITEGQVAWTQKGGNYWEVSIATLYRFFETETLGIAIKNNEGESNPVLRNITFNIIKLY